MGCVITLAPFKNIQSTLMQYITNQIGPSEACVFKRTTTSTCEDKSRAVCQQSMPLSMMTLPPVKLIKAFKIVHRANKNEARPIPAFASELLLQKKIILSILPTVRYGHTSSPALVGDALSVVHRKISHAAAVITKRAEVA